MKRLIKGADANILDSTRVTNQDLVNFLQSEGIDTALYTYELCARKYDRYESGRPYLKRFKCPGNYLAYFSMLMHQQPNANAIEEYYGSLDEFKSFVDTYPKESLIKSYASENWWGDGDDYIFYLKNVDTGRYLYTRGYEDDDYQDSEEW